MAGGVILLGRSGPLPVVTTIGAIPLQAMLLAAMPLAVAVFVWGRWYRLKEHRSGDGLSPAVGVALFAAMFLLGMAGGQVAGTLGGVDGGETLTLSDRVLLTAGLAAGQALVAVAYLVVVGRRAAPKRADPVRAVALGVAALALVWPLVVYAATTGGLVTRLVTDAPVDTIAHDTLRVLVETPVGGLSALLAMLVIGVVPVLEEVTYRGILQRTLIGVGLGPWPAIVATSAIFALVHGGVVEPHALPAIFVLSLGFGWIYEKTGRLVASVSMHVVFNAANIGLAWWAGGSG